MLSGSTADTILHASCSSIATHNVILNFLLLPRILSRKSTNDDRASPVLMVTSGTSMAIYFSTALADSNGSVVRSLPKPLFTDNDKITVAAIESACTTQPGYWSELNHFSCMAGVHRMFTVEKTINPSSMPSVCVLILAMTLRMTMIIAIAIAVQIPLSRAGP